MTGRVAGKDSRDFDWYAFPHDPSDDPAPGEHVAGTWIRVMPEWGVGIPLWDSEGDLGEDHAWIHTELGLSVELLVELTAWNAEWEQAHEPAATRDGPRAPAAWAEDHDRRGRALTDRVRAEIKPGFQVFYKP